MKMIIKLTSLLIVIGTLQACANTTSQSVQTPVATSYSPATTNESYIFRSPPPEAVSAIRGY